jgi:hypothetical protein
MKVEQYVQLYTCIITLDKVTIYESNANKGSYYAILGSIISTRCISVNPLIDRTEPFLLSISLPCKEVLNVLCEFSMISVQL